MKTNRRARSKLLTLAWLLALLLTPATLFVRPALATTTITVELEATDDARIQGGSPDVNFGNGFLHFMTLNGHYVLVQFDLSILPANATIDSAELQLEVVGVNTGPNNIEVGRNNDPWDEATLTWNNQPGITWGGPVTLVDSEGTASWNVTSLVRKWQSGAANNDGFALRGDGGQQVTTHSQETGVAPKLIITYTASEDEGPRPRDLGDAPDSTNHAGVPMTAYPGVQANFPTVFDPATGLPEGPMHARPQPFHLGQQVSREAEADVGPDEDPTNNILPAANVPDQDRFDDGINPQQWSLTHCQATTVLVRVFISPQAANWFQQQEQPGYLNLWLDGNRDGDWEDGGTCPDGQDAVEHIVIDFPVDVVGLGPGLHTLSVPTGLVPWPVQQAENPAWVRVTLSEIESNKTLQFGTIKYSDGRGYAQPFGTGETEDYLAYPKGTVGGGPDINAR